jgi:hypothetical protein
MLWFIIYQSNSTIQNIEILPKSSKPLLFHGEQTKEVHGFHACPAFDGNLQEL